MHYRIRKAATAKESVSLHAACSEKRGLCLALEHSRILRRIGRGHAVTHGMNGDDWLRRAEVVEIQPVLSLLRIEHDEMVGVYGNELCIGNRRSFRPRLKSCQIFWPV